jgi:beta-glucosidase
MDLEMPGGPPMQAWAANPRTRTSGNGAGSLTADKVLAEVKAGHISEATLDANVGRILRVMQGRCCRSMPRRFTRSR